MVLTTAVGGSVGGLSAAGAETPDGADLTAPLVVENPDVINTQVAPLVEAAVYDAATDAYGMDAVGTMTGAESWWDAGYTGAGVDVAVIDTGVSPVPGLATPGKVVYGPDLSFESQAPNLTHLDTNGHGTFMAGVIAGKDDSLTAPYAAAPGSAYRGIAPDARIVSIKVGAANGAVDVSQVIAAINWVVEHKNDNGLNIRILNLSYGTNSAQSPSIDPLAYAAEQAWKHGIVVVTASGNFGYQSESAMKAVSNPALNRFVLGVGSIETNGTASQTDDSVPGFSPWPQRIGLRTVDLLAPGTHVQGLRVPGSFVDEAHPSARLGERFFRGSGTSQSAAVVSGAAALILQKFPHATPDQVKRLLTTTAYRDFEAPAAAVGSGGLQLEAALQANLPVHTQYWLPALGTGSLERARGTDRLTNDGVMLTGEQDIFGMPFSSAAAAAAAAAGTSWTDGTWNGSVWTGSSWSGSSWSGSSWSGSSWSGSSWSGSSWSGSSWSGSSWSGSSWSGSSWSSAGWA